MEMKLELAKKSYADLSNSPEDFGGEPLFLSSNDDETNQLNRAHKMLLSQLLQTPRPVPPQIEEMPRFIDALALIARQEYRATGIQLIGTYAVFTDWVTRRLFSSLVHDLVVGLLSRLSTQPEHQKEAREQLWQDISKWATSSVPKTWLQKGLGANPADQLKAIGDLKLKPSRKIARVVRRFPSSRGPFRMLEVEEQIIRESKPTPPSLVSQLTAFKRRAMDVASTESHIAEQRLQLKEHFEPLPKLLLP